MFTAGCRIKQMAMSTDGTLIPIVFNRQLTDQLNRLCKIK